MSDMLLKRLQDHQENAHNDFADKPTLVAKVNA